LQARITAVLPAVGAALVSSMHAVLCTPETIGPVLLADVIAIAAGTLPVRIGLPGRWWPWRSG
jgi:hypothetical protein